MNQTLKTIFSDHEFWLIVAAGFGTIADAEGHFKLLSFRSIAIAAMVGLVVFHVRRKIKLQKEKNVPFLVVIGKPENEYKDTLNEVEVAFDHFGLDVQTIKKNFRLHQEDWIYHQDSKLSSEPNQWQEAIAKIGEKFWKLAASLPGRKVYHLIMNGPASIALALGATIGSRNQYVFYHYMPATGDTPYHKVIDFKDSEIPEGTHRLKTRVSEMQFIKTTGAEALLDGTLQDKTPEPPVGDASEILVAVHLAGHDPTGDVKRKSNETGRPMLSIHSNFEGTIPLDIDWIRLSQETASVLLKLAASPHVIRMHLFLSMPLPLAFAVGTALGKFVRATVYNAYGKSGEYYEAFNLDDL